jgi:hypothetical protein
MLALMFSLDTAPRAIKTYGQPDRKMAKMFIQLSVLFPLSFLTFSSEALGRY